MRQAGFLDPDQQVGPNPHPQRFRVGHSLLKVDAAMTNNGISGDCAPSHIDQVESDAERAVIDFDATLQ